jgi:hypothetical protein
MKKLVLVLFFLSVGASADNIVHLNSCYDGPLYRALTGATVYTAKDATKQVVFNQQELIVCRTGGGCGAPNNDYNCLLKFTLLSGDPAHAVFAALSDSLLLPSGEKKAPLAVSPAASGSCKKKFCLVNTSLYCTNDNCRVMDEVVGVN